MTLTNEQRAALDQMARLPLQFSAPFAFGPARAAIRDVEINTASITLVRLDGRQLGITNHHVFDAYRKRPKSERLMCQIGNVTIRPDDRLVSECERLDLVVFDLDGINVGHIRGGKEIPCQFLEPRIWPPVLPKTGDFVAFGGFPRTKRVELEPGSFEFGSVSSGGTEVVSVQDDLLTCMVQIEQCVVTLDRDGRGFEDLAGISGCPVLLIHRSPVLHADLVGVVFEYSAPWDILRVRALSRVAPSGRLVA